ncbi:Glutathione-independent formaldehyde dehydrogenase [compost metagenome]
MKYKPPIDAGEHVGRINIAEVVGGQVIILDQAPEGLSEFDAAMPKRLYFILVSCLVRCRRCRYR